VTAGLPRAATGPKYHAEVRRNYRAGNYGRSMPSPADSIVPRWIERL